MLLQSLLPEHKAIVQRCLTKELVQVANQNLGFQQGQSDRVGVLAGGSRQKLEERWLNLGEWVVESQKGGCTCLCLVQVSTVLKKSQHFFQCDLLWLSPVLKQDQRIILAGWKHKLNQTLDSLFPHRVNVSQIFPSPALSEQCQQV